MRAYPIRRVLPTTLLWGALGQPSTDVAFTRMVRDPAEQGCCWRLGAVAVPRAKRPPAPGAWPAPRGKSGERGLASPLQKTHTYVKI